MVDWIMGFIFVWTYGWAFIGTDFILSFGYHGWIEKI